MSTENYIFDVTTETFEQYVINNSLHVPVLVDFWAPWCGPCKSLMPILTKLAEEYDGQFLLAKVNIDEQQELALQFGVRSVPTVKLFRHGQGVDEFSGALPESQLRAFIDQHVEKESDRRLPAIMAQFNAGEQEAALLQLRELRTLEPANRQLVETELEMLLAMKQFSEAQTLLQSLPAELQLEPSIQALHSTLQLQLAASEAPESDELHRRLEQNPNDSEARYQLGVQLTTAGEYEAALQTFLELLRRDRNYGDEAARKGMLMVFDQLGADDELVSRYRRQMFTVLH
ncbi:MAG TPA: thioredoxin [Gammaproteobacteria bacterium]